ncbi:MAG: DUF2007 domain-containing protein [Acidobacteria bacterium]|nr:DUF2007 domain-containing protein [Acidobacteriota bacterium]
MSEKPNPNQKLETVFDTADETEAAVVQGLLESAGLECLVISPDAPGDVMTGLGGVALQVPAERAEEARRLIEEYRAAAASAEEADEEPDAATGTG